MMKERKAASRETVRRCRRANRRTKTKILDEFTETTELNRKYANFGRKRKAIAMGVSRADLVAWPVSYSAADPDKTRFIPPDFEKPLSMRQILADHPKGKEYGHIVSSGRGDPGQRAPRGHHGRGAPEGCFPTGESRCPARPSSCCWTS